MNIKTKISRKPASWLVTVNKHYQNVTATDHIRLRTPAHNTCNNLGNIIEDFQHSTPLSVAARSTRNRSIIPASRLSLFLFRHSSLFKFRPQHLFFQLRVSRVCFILPSFYILALYFICFIFVLSYARPCAILVLVL